MAYTAEQIPKAPILGIGLTSTRKMDIDRKPPAIKPPKKDVYSWWRAGHHAHNEFLQSWYELGAIGVVLLMVAGSSVILSVRRLPEPTQAYVLAQISAFLAIAAFSWGMWQSWLMAVTGLTALYAALAVNRYRIEGLDVFAAVQKAVQRRSRPILLTSLTTFVGLTPMILETSIQAKFLIPMAISLGFGILFTTGITLLLIPCLYMILNDVLFFYRLKNGQQVAEDSPQLTNISN